jgi:hypothetical protein
MSKNSNSNSNGAKAEDAEDGYFSLNFKKVFFFFFL